MFCVKMLLKVGGKAQVWITFANTTRQSTSSERDNVLLSVPRSHQSTGEMQYRGLRFFFAGALALASEGKRGSKFIPGSGCGTTNTIKIINGNPTFEEENNGCIYIENETPIEFRGILSLQKFIYDCKTVRMNRSRAITWFITKFIRTVLSS